MIIFCSVHSLTNYQSFLQESSKVHGIGVTLVRFMVAKLGTLTNMVTNVTDTVALTSKTSLAVTRMWPHFELRHQPQKADATDFFLPNLGPYKSRIHTLGPTRAEYVPWALQEQNTYLGPYKSRIHTLGPTRAEYIPWDELIVGRLFRSVLWVNHEQHMGEAGAEVGPIRVVMPRRLGCVHIHALWTVEFHHCLAGNIGQP